MNEDLMITARKAANGAAAYRGMTGTGDITMSCTEPAADGAAASFILYREGRAYRVTLEELPGQGLEG